VAPKHRLVRENAYRDVWLLIITGFVVWAIWVIFTETHQRRDQNCVVFERLHQIDVVQLSSTYQYLADLSRGQLGTGINKAIIRQLPITEKRMRLSKPPPYCARPGIGLDDRKLEPDPKRPPEVERLLSGH
jgi:hypothetical protein